MVRPLCSIAWLQRLTQFALHCAEALLYSPRAWKQSVTSSYSLLIYICKCRQSRYIDLTWQLCIYIYIDQCVKLTTIANRSYYTSTHIIVEEFAWLVARLLYTIPCYSLLLYIPLFTLIHTVNAIPCPQYILWCSRLWRSTHTDSYTQTNEIIKIYSTLQKWRE